MDKVIRWGIWGTGNIARQVAADFPLTKNSTIHAVASRSLARAQSFAKKHRAPHAYEGLEHLLHNPTVDVVYIATPHRFHAADALACIHAGKAVLCEKPFTLNSDETQLVVDAARHHNVFCMEAMWTRFIPAIREIKRLLDAGAIGNVRLLQGNFGFTAEPGHDVLTQNNAQGGGALMDIGIYLVSLAHHLLGVPDEIRGSAMLTPQGADAQSTYQMTWGQGVMEHGALADFSASLIVNTPNNFLIAGDRGLLQIAEPFFRPHRFTLQRYERPRSASAVTSQPQPSGLGTLLTTAKRHPSTKLLLRKFSPLVSLLRRGETHRHLFSGNGYQFQLDEVAECLQQGRTESGIMPLDDSLAVMRIMDQLRAQWAQPRA